MISSYTILFTVSFEMVLPKRFYQKPTTELAKALLGLVLVHQSPEGYASGIIVETEAYLFKNDPACHAARGKTPRNTAMFGEAGYSYVYQIYGMYYCINVVSGPVDFGEAVLIRALKPLKGIELMQQRRNTNKNKNLCSGPGKLCQALAINRSHNMLNLRSSDLKLYKRKGSQEVSHQDIVCTTRIGINQGKELPLRFYIKNSEYISKP